jgi:hypothetical protein
MTGDRVSMHEPTTALRHRQGETDAIRDMVTYDAVPREES